MSFLTGIPMEFLVHAPAATLDELAEAIVAGDSWVITPPLRKGS